MRHLAAFLTALILSWQALLPDMVHAQAVTTTPIFFTENTSVTITYDATQGNAGLQGFTGNVYIWTGIVTNLSPTNTTWRHTRSPNFNQPDPNALMTRSSTNPNIYTITFTPRTFYPVPAGETILRLAMLFKDGAGNTVGRTDTGGDFFIDVWQGGLAVRILQPTGVGSDPRLNPLFVSQGAQLAIQASSSTAATLTLSVNGTPATTATGTSLSYTLTAGSPGRQLVRVRAQAGADTASDAFSVVVRPAVTVAPLPASVPVGQEDGVTYLSPTSAVLVLTAPNKQFVYALGEWSGFRAEQPGYMNKTPDGNRWWVQLNNLTPGQVYAYQFLVDGTLRVADPYADLILDPDDDSGIPAATYPNRPAYPSTLTTGNVSVLQTNQTPYVWTATNYQKPKETDLVVYELLVRDFIARHDYQTLTDTLDYLQRLGVTAIELMPVNEFEGNDSWGYNGSFHFALDKYYGTRQAYKQFIDACHQRGMAVIMDIALNHAFGENPMVRMYFDAANQRPAANSPWFNAIARHDFNVGYDFNHESAFTKYYSKRVMHHWMTEFHVDGFRFDLSKGFTQFNSLGNTGLWGQRDPSRIAIWKDYADHMWSLDSTAYVILEHFADNTEERELANYRHGMMPWGNAHGTMTQAANGLISNSDFAYGISYRLRGWNKPRLVGYAESHDEERLMYTNLTQGNITQAANGYSVRDPATALARQEAIAAFLLGTPGPKMIWQFGELGYDVSINVGGRTGRKPIRWNYLQERNRRHLYDVYRAMNKLRQHPVYDGNPQFNFMSPGSSIKTLRVNSAAFNILIICNFSVLAQTTTPGFQQGGLWYDYLRGDSVDVTANPTLSLAPGEYRVFTTVRQTLPTGTILGVAPALTAEATGFAIEPMAWPNPTSAGQTLTVGYELNHAATVRATVCDLLGRVIVTVPATRQASGLQSLELPTALAAGTYVVRVQAGELAPRSVRVVIR